jgi:hypothetical protein
MSTDLSRRAIMAGAASVPALALPAVAAVEPTDELVQLANQMCAAYDRLGTLGRNIEESDWELYDSLGEQLWETPANSISGVIAKARVVDQFCRIDGEPHSTTDRLWDVIDDLLAMGVQS